VEGQLSTLRRMITLVEQAEAHGAVDRDAKPSD
jgi:hypothetical protein